jgi:hypothetical protein
LIWFQNGWTRKAFGDLVLSEAEAWEKLRERHPSLTAHLGQFAEAARKRQNKGQFWWELNPCDYYDAFAGTKIFWPDIAKFPRFSWDEQAYSVNNTGYFAASGDISLLGILQSRICWFCITWVCASLGECAGLIRYRHFTQYMTHLPIPPLTDPQRTRIGNLTQRLTETARERYEVWRKTTHRIEHDLGTPNAKLNQRLTEWWQLSFSEFREELAKVFKRDIPLKDRDDWEALLRERTAEIVALETELNTAVYDVFGLDEAERKLIEAETKYLYGEW